MNPLDLQPLPDGCVQVSLSDGACTASCIVSSMHLVEDKRKQLTAALHRCNNGVAQRGATPEP